MVPLFLGLTTKVINTFVRVFFVLAGVAVLKLLNAKLRRHFKYGFYFEALPTV